AEQVPGAGSGEGSSGEGGEHGDTTGGSDRRGAGADGEVEHGDAADDGEHECRDDAEPQAQAGEDARGTRVLADEGVDGRPAPARGLPTLGGDDVGLDCRRQVPHDPVGPSTGSTPLALATPSGASVPTCTPAAIALTTCASSGRCSVSGELPVTRTRSCGRPGRATATTQLPSRSTGGFPGVRAGAAVDPCVRPSRVSGVSVRNAWTAVRPSTSVMSSTRSTVPAVPTARSTSATGLTSPLGTCSTVVEKVHTAGVSSTSVTTTPAEVTPEPATAARASRRPT